MARVALLVTVLAVLGYISQAIPVPENVEDVQPKFEIKKISENREIKAQLEELKDNDFPDKSINQIKESLGNEIQKISEFELLLKQPSESNLKHVLSGIEDIGNNIKDISQNQMQNLMQELIKETIIRISTTMVQPYLKVAEIMWDVVKGSVEDASVRVKETLDKARENLGKLINMGEEALNKLNKRVNNGLDELKDKIGELRKRINYFSDLVEDELKDLPDKFREHIKTILEEIKSLSNTFENVLGELRNKKDEMFQEAKNLLQPLINAKINQFQDALKNGKEALEIIGQLGLGKGKDLFKDMFDIFKEVSEIATGIFGKSVNIGINVGNKVGDMAGKAADSFIKGAGKVGDGVMNEVKNLLDVGKSFGDSLKNNKGGIIGGISDGKIAEGMLKGAGKVVDDTGNLMKKVTKDVMKGTGDAFDRLTG